MFKKVFILCFVAILFITSVTSGSSIYSGEDPTKQRVVTEYCELYMYRIDRLKYSGLDYGIEPVVFPTVLSVGSDVSVSAASGVLYIDPKTMAIQKASLDFYDFNKTEEENDAYYISAAIGFSALEYSSFDDDMFEITKLNGSNSASEEGLRILSECFNYFIANGGLEQAFDGDKVLIYSGNYDYYLRYYSSETRNYDVLWLEAEARD